MFFVLGLREGRCVIVSPGFKPITLFLFFNIKLGASKRRSILVLNLIFRLLLVVQEMRCSVNKPQAISRVLRVKEDLPLPPGCKTTLRETYLSLLNNMEAKHQPQEPFYELLELATHPSYQRKGIGSQLVNYGLERAERDGKKVYLSAAPKGVPVYTKLGFGEVGRLEFPLGEWGGDGVHVHVAMVKEPGVRK